MNSTGVTLKWNPEKMKKKLKSLKKKVSDESNIFTAAAEGKLKDVKRHLGNSSKSIDINARDEWGATALMIAASFGHHEVLKYLSSQGGKLDTKDYDLNTALILAAEGGHLDTVKCLIGGNVEIECKDKNGNTAMLLSCAHGFEDVAVYLKEVGADVTVEGVGGVTALDWAYMKGFGEKLDPDLEKRKALTPERPKPSTLSPTQRRRPTSAVTPDRAEVKMGLNSTNERARPSTARQFSNSQQTPLANSISRPKPSPSSPWKLAQLPWTTRLFKGLIFQYGQKVAPQALDSNQMWDFLNDEGNMIDSNAMRKCLQLIGLNGPEKMMELEKADHLDIIKKLNTIAARKYKKMIGLVDPEVSQSLYPGNSRRSWSFRGKISSENLLEMWKVLNDDSNFLDADETNRILNSLGVSTAERLLELEEIDHRTISKNLNRIASRRYKKLCKIEEPKPKQSTRKEREEAQRRATAGAVSLDVWNLLNESSNSINFRKTQKCLEKIGVTKPEKIAELEDDDHKQILAKLNKIAARKYEHLFATHTDIHRRTNRSEFLRRQASHHDEQHETF